MVTRGAVADVALVYVNQPVLVTVELEGRAPDMLVMQDKAAVLQGGFTSFGVELSFVALEQHAGLSHHDVPTQRARSLLAI